MAFKRKLIYRFGKALLKPYVFHIIKSINNFENVPTEYPFIIVANHESYIDPVIIKEIFESYRKKCVFYLTKIESYNSPIKRYFFNSVGTIPLDRQKKDIQALNSAVEKLSEGEIIGLFPEGTRSRDGKLHTGKTGAVRLALIAKCPMLPIGIKNSYELWPPKKKLPSLKKIVIVNVGKPISLEEYYGKEVTKELLRKLTDDVMVEIGKLCGEEYIHS